jgi:hypothetical protein
LGHSPAVIYYPPLFGVFSLEELLRLLGHAPQASLTPFATDPP